MTTGWPRRTIPRDCGLKSTRAKERRIATFPTNGGPPAGAELVAAGERFGDGLLWLDGGARSASATALLERMINHHERSAAKLRAHGRTDAARRVEQFAARTRLIQDEPKLTQRMHALSQDLHDASGSAALIQRALEGAMQLTGADFGNVQLSVPGNGTLRIAAESGFGSEFLEYFAEVDDSSSACGRAAAQHRQTVIADVLVDEAFAPHREIAAASGFRAVQSTPLVDPGGRLVGVLSTHFRTPHRPPSRDLQIIEWYAEHVAEAIVRLQAKNGWTTSGQRWAAARRVRERAREERERARAVVDHALALQAAYPAASNGHRE